MKKILLCLTLGLMLAGCTTQKDFILLNDTNVTHSKAKKSVTTIKQPIYEYKIQPHDRISITMYNHPELGTSSVQSQRQDVTGVLVNARGYVRLPLIKSIHIAGLTQTTAQKKIEKAFGKFLEDAEVYLEVLNKRAFVLGEVKNPGAVQLFNEKLTLLQSIALAGGLTDFANRKSIIIMEQRQNKIYTQNINLIDKDSIRMANLMIYPNDIIYVSPNSMKAFNVGVNEASPIFGLVGKITEPIVNIKYLGN